MGKVTVSGEASLLIAEHTGKSLSAFEEKIMNVVMYLIVVTLLDVVVVIIVQVRFGVWCNAVGLVRSVRAGSLSDTLILLN